jgi:hypothetical protein
MKNNRIPKIWHWIWLMPDEESVTKINNLSNQLGINHIKQDIQFHVTLSDSNLESIENWENRRVKLKSEFKLRGCYKSFYNSIVLIPTFEDEFKQELLKHTASINQSILQSGYHLSLYYGDSISNIQFVDAKLDLVFDRIVIGVADEINWSWHEI